MKHIIPLLALLIAGPAAAQSDRNCGPRDALVAHLAVKYAETLRGVGLSGLVLVEFYASDAGTWTMVVSTSDGMACLTAAGDSWSVIEGKKGIDG